MTDEANEMDIINETAVQVDGTAGQEANDRDETPSVSNTIADENQAKDNNDTKGEVKQASSNKKARRVATKMDAFIINANTKMSTIVEADSTTEINETIVATFKGVEEPEEDLPMCTCQQEDDDASMDGTEDDNKLASDGGVGRKHSMKGRKKSKGVEKKKKGKGKGKGKGRRQEQMELEKVAEPGAAMPISEEEVIKVVMKLQKKYRKAQKDMCVTCKNQSVTKIHTTLKVGETDKEYNMQMYLFDLVNLAREGMPAVPSKYLN